MRKRVVGCAAGSAKAVLPCLLSSRLCCGVKLCAVLCGPLHKAQPPPCPPRRCLPSRPPACLQVKAEIQALSSFGFQYLSQQYLPLKLQEGDWI